MASRAEALATMGAVPAEVEEGHRRSGRFHLSASAGLQRDHDGALRRRRRRADRVSTPFHLMSGA